MSKDYERGVEQASAIYKEVIREYVADNAKLRKLVKRMHDHIKESCDMCDEYYCSNFDEDNECCVYDTLAREVGIEVDECANA